jgi:hypothetical protein
VGGGGLGSRGELGGRDILDELWLSSTQRIGDELGCDDMLCLQARRLPRSIAKCQFDNGFDDGLTTGR